ncbi:MAG TPA: metalloregulator ArsR/SmtB family transcription factor [Anaerolineae bacterium]|nr:metalloregulator ArsR/SmtB family transcription factor [Anaerolineae bacterium]
MDHQFSQSAVKVFKALADPTRYQIVVMLMRNEELGCGDFDCIFHKSKPALSHHYRVLENAGLVAFRKDGLRVYYHLHREQLERFVPQFFQAHCGGPGETSG